MTTHLRLTYATTWLVAFSLVGPSASTRSSPRAAGLLLVANQTDRTLSVIDPDTGNQIAAVPEGGVTGHEVAISPDGTRAFVPIYGSSGVGQPGMDGSTIDVIDLATDRVMQTFDFGHGVRPTALSSDQPMDYSTSQRS